MRRVATPRQKRLAMMLANNQGGNLRQALLDSAPFRSSLTYTAVPQSAASGTTATFTRATTETWQNNDGYMVTGVAGEIGFVGARRIYNRLTNTGWSGAASGTYGTHPTGWVADVGTGTLTVASSSTYSGHNQITFTATAQRPFIRLAVAVSAYSVNILSVRLVENATSEPINDIITASSVPAGSTETYSVGGSTVAASYVPVAGDVIEYKITTAATAGTPNWRIGLGCQGAATGSVTLVAPQLEDVTAQTTQTAGEYVSVGVESAPYYHGSFVDGVKCFPTGLAGNALTTMRRYNPEGARTNLFTQSQVVASWASFSVTGVAQTANQYVAPDGTTTGDQITAVAGNTQHFVVGSSGGLTAGVNTLSFYFVYDNHQWVQIHVNDGSNVPAAAFDIQNGVKGSITGGYSSAIESVGNGTFRCSITGTFLAAVPGIYISLIPSDTATPAPTWNATGTEKVGIWGAQVELGPFASSYIPTTTAAVTRNAEIDAYSTASNITAAAGYISLQFTPTHTPSGTIALWGTYVDASNYTAILHDATNLIFRKRIAGSNYDATIANAFVSGTTYKMAATWGAAGTSIALDGTLGTGHANTTAAQIAATMQFGADGNSLQQPFASVGAGYIGQRQLSASEMQAITR